MNAPALSRIEPSALAVAKPMTPMEMLASAIERGMAPETVDKLMALAERFDKTNQRKAFDAAVAAAKAEIPVIAKNREGHNNKRYADLAAIARVVDPILSKHGLGYRYRTTQDDRIHVTCVLFHKDGHSEDNSLAGLPDASGSKNAIQAIGSTLTYLQRYTLTQALGLAASEDDDGKAAASGETITDEQVDELRELLQKTGGNEVRFLKSIKLESLTEIAVEKFEKAKGLINSRVKA